MAGRVTGVTGNAGIRIEHGWELAWTRGGEVADPSGLDGLDWVPAQVPGTAASALRTARTWSVDEPFDFDAKDVWFRAPLGAELGAGCVLGFDGIATLWDIWVDGVHVAAGDSMWQRHEVVLEHTPRQLVIRCRSLDHALALKRPRPRWKVPMLEQQQLRWLRTSLLGRTPGWSPPCPAVGPWRPIWLEQRSHRVGEIAIHARLEHGVGVVEVQANLDADLANLVVMRGETRVIVPCTRRDGRWYGRAIVEQPALWWPHTHGQPALYDVVIDATHGERAFKISLGRTGFRTLTVAEDMTVVVNGVEVFCRGACWTPLDIISLQATPAALDAAIAGIRDAGMNMLRISGTMTYESDAFHDALDAQGVLLWQDLMFANMDYPEDPGFTAKVEHEVATELARLQARPSLAIVCGNSEGEQQAAMWGAPRARWAPALFHQVIPAIVARVLPGTFYTPSSTSGGAFPHASNAGPSSYYGVGAYLRPLEDARRAEVAFASECLAFANIPTATNMRPGIRVHQPEWKSTTPRDLGAGWDFDDVRDHYVQRVFGVDPVALRTIDHERYLELGRHATGEVMARTFGEWRRARSVTRGALIWFLKDLRPGAGWGVLDSDGRPKLCWYAIRRALAPIALAITDEGTNGLALHLVNETPEPVTRSLELTLWRGGDTNVGRAAREITVPARGAIELPAMALFDGFYDLSYAYRFGPPGMQVIRAAFGQLDCFWFPAGMPAMRAATVGLVARREGPTLTVSAQQFAQFVAIDLPGWIPDDDGFHLAPGQSRTITLKRFGDGAPDYRGSGTVTALNAEAGAKVELIAEHSP